MKEYVLDQALSAELSPPAPIDDGYRPSSARTSWRTIALLVVLEALALGLLYVALVGVPTPTQASVENPAAYVAPIAPRSPIAPEPQAQPVAEVAAPLPSRISREHGRYVIDLHGAEVGPALAMLTQATGATVRGADVLAGNASRITRTVATDSALEAWQAVFGGVANFAATCSHGACDVRFVRSADSALAAMRALPQMAARTPPPAAVTQPGDEPQTD
jgi:hypothetical protein